MARTPAPIAEDRLMVKAVVSGGVIRPLEPLPEDWREGQSVVIEKAENLPDELDNVDPEEVDRDFAELAAPCANRDAEDEEIMARALGEQKRIAKDQVRREMGL
jgi:hypothetical protein